MSWSNIIGKTMTIVRAKINSAVNKFDDKEARLDLAVEEFKTAIEMLKKASVLMSAKKNQINNYIGDTEKSILRARAMAAEQKKAGRDELAKIHLGTVAYGEASITEWTTIQTKLAQDIESIGEDVIFCDQGIIAITMRIDILKAREDVADARNQVYAEISGLKTRGLSLAESLTDYEVFVEEKEAKTQAYQDLMAMGILKNVVKESLPVPEAGRVDELMAELEQEIRVATNTKLNPKEIDLYANAR